MPFGLANAGSVYSRMLDVALKEVDRDFWTSYLDDILWEALGTLRTFGRGSLGTRSRWNQDTTLKTKLFKSAVEYLGQKINKGRVSMILKYVQKIKDWPIRKSEKEVATFLGFPGYYTPSYCNTQL